VKQSQFSRWYNQDLRCEAVTVFTRQNSRVPSDDKSPRQYRSLSNVAFLQARA
jgi:hypothetical protein